MALLLKETDVRQLLPMNVAIEALERAFRARSDGTAVNLPRQRVSLPEASLNVLAAVSTALDAAAVKCYPIVRNDVTVGSSFTVLVYGLSDGSLRGIVEANTLGQIRTGAASAVATRYLARAESRTAVLFGAGWQAESQVEALATVLPQLERVHVVGRDPVRVQLFCAILSERVGKEVQPCTDVERAVHEADIIITATGAASPLFDGRWLRAGVHVNAVGSNYAEKQELDAFAVRRADIVVVDDPAVARVESGDLIAAEAQGAFEWKDAVPLHEIVARGVSARNSAEQITLFESHGLGLEDLAVAKCALDRARERGVGIEVPIR
jgi:ornithine cyclodeaminase/alanine dehydrogenase-like protein (mu-crystallin family)